MTDGIRYYPLIEGASDGTLKVPMLMAADEDMAKRGHDLWLMEIVPYCFRLCSTEEGLGQLRTDFTVNCPMCGKTLTQIAGGTSRYRHGLYVCNRCKEKKEEDI